MNAAVPALTAPDLKGSVLIVCSGNVCRSPVAAELLRDALDSSSVDVRSAGLIATPGSPVQGRMLQAVQRRRPDAGPVLHRLAAFRSARVSSELIEVSDLVLTMTQSQRSDVVAAHPSAVRTTFTLAQFAEIATDVAALLVDLDEPKPHAVSDFVDLVPQVRGRRRPLRRPDITDPMGRSLRAHVRALREIDSAVAAVGAAMSPSSHG